MTQAVCGVPGPEPTELALSVFQLRSIVSCNLEKRTAFLFGFASFNFASSLG